MKKITVFALNLGVGGIEKYISLLVNMFCNDYEVNIISTYKAGKEPSFYINEKVKISYLINDFPYDVSLKKLLKNWQILSAFKEIFRRLKIQILVIVKNKKAIKNLNTDIIITTRAFHNNLISKYYNKRNTILIATDHNYPQNKRYFNTLRKSLKQFDYLVLGTKELVDIYKGKICGTRICLIPNPLSNISKTDNLLKGNQIISVGRFSEEKGYLDLIEVMKKIHGQDTSITLTLIGDGPLMSIIKNKVKEQKLDSVIKLPGFMSQENINKEYLKSSLFVMTSFTEAFGLVLIEAMSYGLPCIAFDSASGARELLKNNIGELVKNRDKQVMADKIVLLLQNKEKLRDYQNRIKTEIKKYLPENIYKLWQEIL